MTTTLAIVEYFTPPKPSMGEMSQEQWDEFGRAVCLILGVEWTPSR